MAKFNNSEDIYLKKKKVNINTNTNKGLATSVQEYKLARQHKRV